MELAGFATPFRNAACGDLEGARIKQATFVFVHPGSRLVEKVVQVERQVPNDSSVEPQNTLFESALRAAGVQLVRLSPLHAYTVPGLVTVLDLAEPE